jgi:hypothetical protein
MSDDAPESLVGSLQLLSSIESFSESVTQFLLPVIRFVGHKGELFDELERRFSGLVHEKHYSHRPAHLVIFNEMPYPLLTPVHPINADAAYLFCLDDRKVLNDQHLEFLRSRVSMVLTQPTAEDVIEHVKTLLILQDIAYVNNNICYVPLLSVDVQFRQCISRLIAASINLNSCMICVGTVALQQMLNEFVFDSHPSVIRPYLFDHEDCSHDDLPNDRTSITLPHCESAAALQSLCVALTQAMISKPVIAIVVCNDADPLNSYTPFPAFVLPTLNTRPIDAKIIAYWCSAFQAHAFDSPKYYSQDQIDEKIGPSNGNPDVFMEMLLGTPPDSETLDKYFVELTNQYDRLSIDDIFDVAERRVMQNLRERSSIVDAASNAAGIPKVTFHKRMKRLAEKQTLLSLLFSVRSDD